jgi:catechol-2,3-dioxygenase
VNKSEHCIKALGEVSIRVKDLRVMQAFYEEVLGLGVLRREDDFVFYRVGDGYGGHPQVVALFAAGSRDFLESKSVGLSSQGSTLHHIAFNLALVDFESEKQRLESLGLKVEATVHEWLHVRSLYFSDPEGNLLEFVCRDEGI